MTTVDYGIKPPRYRLPDATHVGRVSLQVADVSRSIDYYSRTVGLHVIDARVNMLGSADRRVLIELHERRGARSVPQSGVLGLYHFAILLPDRAALSRFVRHLGQAGLQFGAADHLVSEAIYLWDPDGLGIEVYADRPRARWRVNHGQLAMATDALDLESLTRLDETPWTGMPAGTTMGHIHLQVGDLERAREFYHVALGLDIIVWGYPGALFLAAGGYHHHVGVNTWARRARPATEDDARVLEWQLLVPSRGSVTAVEANANASGFSATRDGEDAILADPWGTTLRVTDEGPRSV